MKKALFLCYLAFASGFVFAQNIKPIMVTGVQIQPPAFEEAPIFRIQLKLTTGVGASASTDETPYVQFNDDDKRFYLYRPIDNFEEGLTDTYDILTSAISKIKDIKYIRFGLTGTDGWCVKKVQLLLNNNPVPVFIKEYPSHGNCIDNRGSFVIPGSELRQCTSWAYDAQHRNLWQSPAVISKDIIKSMVEGAIGNQLNYTSGFAWGDKSGIDTRWGDAVELKKTGNQTLHFDLDLQRTLYGPNPEVDVDFDLVFGCVAGKVVTSIQNFKTRTNLIADLQEAVRIAIATAIASALVGSLGQNGAFLGLAIITWAISNTQQYDLQHPNIPSSCLGIHVADNGDVYLR